MFKLLRSLKSLSTLSKQIKSMLEDGSITVEELLNFVGTIIYIIEGKETQFYVNDIIKKVVISVNKK